MKIYNNDGSYAEMCGNGLRCFCALLVREGLAGLKVDEDKYRLEVSTDAGKK